jgi:hypothetical protein
MFGPTPGTNIVVNAAGTQITVTAPSRPAGTVFVIVTATAGTSSPTVPSQYTYGALPVITSISPTTGPIAGGTTVTITGTGFTGATAVHFGTTPATSFTVVNDTTITAVAPAGTAGGVDIRVTTAVGQSAVVTAGRFTYTAAGERITYTLAFRWTLLSWGGEDGIAISVALAGSGDTDDQTNDISGQVTAIYRWNPAQRWEANFPGSGNVPGANDFTTLEFGRSYFIAIRGPGSVTWTVLAGP